MKWKRLSLVMLSMFTALPLMGASVNNPNYYTWDKYQVTEVANHKWDKYNSHVGGYVSDNISDVDGVYNTSCSSNAYTSAIIDQTTGQWVLSNLTSNPSSCYRYSTNNYGTNYFQVEYISQGSYGTRISTYKSVWDAEAIFRDGLIGIVSSTSADTYTSDTRNLDGFWYVYKGTNGVQETWDKYQIVLDPGYSRVSTSSKDFYKRMFECSTGYGCSFYGTPPSDFPGYWTDNFYSTYGAYGTGYTKMQVINGTIQLGYSKNLDPTGSYNPMSIIGYARLNDGLLYQIYRSYDSNTAERKIIVHKYSPRAIEGGASKGALVQSNISAVNGPYPNNGPHTDGYWYIKTTPLQTKGTLVQSGVKALDNTYPANGIYVDGFWYVKTGLAPNNPPIGTVNNASQMIPISQTTFSLTGTIQDLDNDDVLIEATISGVTKQIIISNTITTKNWTLTWNKSEIVEGNYKNIIITMTDGK